MMSFDGANNLIRGLREVKRLSRAKFSISSLKCHFWKNHRKDGKGEFSNFYEFNLYMIFEFFLRKSHYRKNCFQKNRGNHI